MKKIVPFSNTLTFATDVCEITAISLEHEFKPSEDEISGKFFISGEYKITDGQIDLEKFNFELPFDIALGTKYNTDTLLVDIDDFHYELLDNNKLKVDIDLYIDGEEAKELSMEREEEVLDVDAIDIRDDIDLSEDSEDVKDIDDSEDVKDIDIFDDINKEEKYVTYRVYRVIDGDSIEKIIDKYKVTKEDLLKYNTSLDIKTGDKLIIPANE